MAQQLTHAFISKPLTPGRYFDTTKGLHLFVKVNGRKYWIFRFTMAGKRHDLGLGPYPEVALAGAREEALRLRQAIRRGENPLAKTQVEAAPSKPTFSVFSSEFIQTHAAQWQNAKHIDQWHSTLRDYAFPVIGEIPVDQVATEHILRILTPIWSEKTETASRLRGRIERVLGAATAQQLRSGLNPAQWRGHLEYTLPAPKRVKRVKHHAALPYRMVHEVICALQEKDCTSALALEFLILTAARTGEVRFAKWSEIQDNLWVVPAGRMKAKREHRVPLTTRCLEILAIARSVLGSAEYIFHRDSRPLSNVAMANLLEGIAPGNTVHGFRSTFRDWVAEETEHPSDVAEMALAHKIENPVEASYRRGDLLNRRRRLMDDWANYCGNAPTQNVLSIDRRAA
jgi:integrase